VQENKAGRQEGKTVTEVYISRIRRPNYLLLAVEHLMLLLLEHGTVCRWM